MQVHLLRVSVLRPRVSRFSSLLYTTMSSWKPNSYPQARRSDHVDTYESKKHGSVKVPDPYNWLEEHSEETERWIESQVEFTRAHLDQNPDRSKLEDAIRKSTDYAKFTAPTLKKDGRWYWSYNTGLQAQSVIRRSLGKDLPELSEVPETEAGEDFFDPNLLSKDGTTAIQTSKFSQCGKYYAYALALSGSDFSTIYVRKTDSPLSTVTTPEKLSSSEEDKGRLQDEVRFVKFSSLTWTHDSKGFFYQRMPTREKHGKASEDKAGTETDLDVNAMLYYHVVGTPQANDVLVMQDPENPTWMWGTQVSEIDGRYLYLYVSKDTSRKNKLWVTDLTENEIGPNMKWTKLIDEFDADYNIVANDGTRHYLCTNKNAPKYKLIALDIANPSTAPTDVLLEDPEAALEDVTAIGNVFSVVYKRDVKDELYIYSSTGKRLQRIMPDFVGAIAVSARRDQDFLFASLTGFTSPGIIVKCDLPKDKVEAGSAPFRVFRTTTVAGIEPNDFDAEQVWYTSKDGTKVPMFVVRHKSTPRDGSAMAIQYGYGGFTIPVNPFFSPAIMTFLQKYRAVLVVPNIRGGGEFGEEWHLAGTRERKTNCFDDFLAATEYLIEHKVAARGKIVLSGGSNGGLLVGACINRAPEGLLGGAVADVGVMDMLKFNKFTIGRAWTSDYGNPEVAEDFDFIYPYSPVHNVPADKKLPPTILLTADHDDRVVPLHSFKLAATLQHLRADNPNPLLIRIDKKAGHGAGKSTEAKIKESADKWGFIAQNLGLQWQED